MDDLRRGLLGDFQKSELISLARELELDVTRRSRAPAVIDALLEDLKENGIPDPDGDDISDSMFEFLVAAEFIADDGTILESDDEEGDDEPEDEEVDLPECYGVADDRDPACKKCVYFDECKEERIVIRPECFGRLYDKNAEECKVCIEANACRKSKT